MIWCMDTLNPASVLGVVLGVLLGLLRLPLLPVGLVFGAILCVRDLSRKQSVRKLGRRGRLLQWLELELGMHGIHLAALWLDGSLLCQMVQKVNGVKCVQVRHPHGHVLALKHGFRMVKTHLDVPSDFSDSELEAVSLTTSMEKRLARYLYAVRRAVLRRKVRQQKEVDGTPLSSSSSTDSSSEGFLQKKISRYRCIARGIGLIIAHKMTSTSFFIYTRTTGCAPKIRVQILGPDGSHGSVNLSLPVTQEQLEGREVSPGSEDVVIPIDLRVRVNRIQVSYVPQLCGLHELSVLCDGNHAYGSPFRLVVDEPACITHSDTSFEVAVKKQVDQPPLKIHDKGDKKRVVVYRIIDFVDKKLVMTKDGKLEQLPNAIVTYASAQHRKYIPYSKQTFRNNRKCKRLARRTLSLVKPQESAAELEETDEIASHSRFQSILHTCSLILKHLPASHSLYIMRTADDIIAGNTYIRQKSTGVTVEPTVGMTVQNDDDDEAHPVYSLDSPGDNGKITVNETETALSDRSIPSVLENTTKIGKLLEPIQLTAAEDREVENILGQINEKQIAVLNTSDEISSESAKIHQSNVVENSKIETHSAPGSEIKVDFEPIICAPNIDEALRQLDIGIQKAQDDIRRSGSSSQGSSQNGSNVSSPDKPECPSFPEVATVENGATVHEGIQPTSSYGEIGNVSFYTRAGEMEKELWGVFKSQNVAADSDATISRAVIEQERGESNQLGTYIHDACAETKKEVKNVYEHVRESESTTKLPDTKDEPRGKFRKSTVKRIVGEIEAKAFLAESDSLRNLKDISKTSTEAFSSPLQSTSLVLNVEKQKVKSKEIGEVLDSGHVFLESMTQKLEKLLEMEKSNFSVPGFDPNGIEYKNAENNMNDGTQETEDKPEIKSSDNYYTQSLQESIDRLQSCTTRNAGRESEVNSDSSDTRQSNEMTHKQSMIHEKETPVISQDSEIESDIENQFETLVKKEDLEPVRTEIEYNTLLSVGSLRRAINIENPFQLDVSSEFVRPLETNDSSTETQTPASSELRDTLPSIPVRIRPRSLWSSDRAPYVPGVGKEDVALTLQEKEDFVDDPLPQRERFGNNSEPNDVLDRLKTHYGQSLSSVTKSLECRTYPNKNIISLNVQSTQDIVRPEKIVILNEISSENQDSLYTKTNELCSIVKREISESLSAEIKNSSTEKETPRQLLHSTKDEESLYISSDQEITNKNFKKTETRKLYISDGCEISCSVGSFHEEQGVLVVTDGSPVIAQGLRDDTFSYLEEKLEKTLEGVEASLCENTATYKSYFPSGNDDSGIFPVTNPTTLSPTDISELQGFNENKLRDEKCVDGPCVSIMTDSNPGDNGVAVSEVISCISILQTEELDAVNKDIVDLDEERSELSIESTLSSETTAGPNFDMTKDDGLDLQEFAISSNIVATSERCDLSDVLCTNSHGPLLKETLRHSTKFPCRSNKSSRKISDLISKYETINEDGFVRTKPKVEISSVAIKSTSVSDEPHKVTNPNLLNVEAGMPKKGVYRSLERIDKVTEGRSLDFSNAELTTKISQEGFPLSMRVTHRKIFWDNQVKRHLDENKDPVTNTKTDVEQSRPEGVGSGSEERPRRQGTESNKSLSSPTRPSEPRKSRKDRAPDPPKKSKKTTQSRRETEFTDERSCAIRGARKRCGADFEYQSIVRKSCLFFEGMKDLEHECAERVPAPEIEAVMRIKREIERQQVLFSAAPDVQNSKNVPEGKDMTTNERAIAIPPKPTFQITETVTTKNLKKSVTGETIDRLIKKDQNVREGKGVPTTNHKESFVLAADVLTAESAQDDPAPSAEQCQRFQRAKSFFKLLEKPFFHSRDEHEAATESKELLSLSSTDSESSTSSERVANVVESFRVKDIFQDVLGSGSNRSLKGIPNRNAVLAALSSFNHSDTSAYESVVGMETGADVLRKSFEDLDRSDEEAPSPSASTPTPIQHVVYPMPKDYQEEYPYLPTTPFGSYRPRSAPLEKQFILRKDIFDERI